MPALFLSSTFALTITTGASASLKHTHDEHHHRNDWRDFGTIIVDYFFTTNQHLLRNKSAKDISSGTYLIILFSELGSLIYGILTESPAIIITTIIACFSALIILFLKLKYNGLLSLKLQQNSSAHSGPNS